MMEKFCQGSIVVQTKVKSKSKRKKKPVTKPKKLSKEEVLVRKLCVLGDVHKFRHLKIFMNSFCSRFSLLTQTNLLKKFKLSIFMLLRSLRTIPTQPHYQSSQTSGTLASRRIFRWCWRTTSIFRKTNIQFRSTWPLRSRSMSNGRRNFCLLNYLSELFSLYIQR